MGQFTSADVAAGLRSVCNFTGFVLGNPADKSTWRIEFAAGETDQRKADAAAFIAAFDTSDAAQASRENAALRAAAGAALSASNDESAQRDRAIMLVLLDENNTLRQWLMGLKTQIAAATSLANLKTGVASLPAMPDRTAAQARAAIQTKLTSGQGEA